VVLRVRTAATLLDEFPQPWIAVHEPRHRYTFQKHECPQNFQLQHTCLYQTLSFLENFSYFVLNDNNRLGRTLFAYYDRACISLIQSQHQSFEYICTRTHTIIQGCRKFNFLSFLSSFQEYFNFNFPLYRQRLMENYMMWSKILNFTFSWSDRCTSVWLQRGLG
jgi:hypothetical protein